MSIVNFQIVQKQELFLQIKNKINSNDPTAYDQVHHKALFVDNMVKKYSKSERTKIIWKKIL